MINPIALLNRSPQARFVLRNLVRALIVLTGIAGIYFIATEVFPELDRRLPIFYALFFCYLIAAYLLFPFVIRLKNAAFPPKHIPRYTVTPDGFINDPVNISVIGTKHQLVNAMSKAGWVEAEPKTLLTSIKLLWAFFFNKPYPSAPFSTLLLLGRRQDLGFQKQVEGKVGDRHHVRFWSISKDTPEEFKEHLEFWRKAHADIKSPKLLWVGAAIKDEGLGLIRHHGQVSHSVNPDTDAERDKLVEDLKTSGFLRSTTKVRAGNPITVRNRVIGSHMFADGQITVCILN